MTPEAIFGQLPVCRVAAFRRRCVLAVVLLGGLGMAATAEDPYAAWFQGRPGESVAPLVAAAKASGRWDAWLDAGLAAAAVADGAQRGTAVACLLRAQALAPGRPEPVQALRALEVPLPATWGERAGPAAIPGQGWAGVVLLAVAGLALGAALAVPRRRGLGLAVAGGAIVLALPGVAAPLLDGRRTWAAPLRDTHALDSTGAPLAPVAAGTLLERGPGAPWNGRILVTLPDGRSAYLAQADVDP